MKHQRNEPCHCGSELKYKRCCGSPSALAMVREKEKQARLEAYKKRQQERSAVPGAYLALAALFQTLP